MTHLAHREYFFAVMPIIYGAGLYLLTKDPLLQFSVPEAPSTHAAHS